MPYTIPISKLSILIVLTSTDGIEYFECIIYTFLYWVHLVAKFVNLCLQFFITILSLSNWSFVPLFFFIPFVHWAIVLLAPWTYKLFHNHSCQKLLHFWEICDKRFGTSLPFCLSFTNSTAFPVVSCLGIFSLWSASLSSAASTDLLSW